MPITLRQFAEPLLHMATNPIGAVLENAKPIDERDHNNPTIKGRMRSLNRLNNTPINENADASSDLSIENVKEAGGILLFLMFLLVVAIIVQFVTAVFIYPYSCKWFGEQVHPLFFSLACFIPQVGSLVGLGINIMAFIKCQFKVGVYATVSILVLMVALYFAFVYFMMSAISDLDGQLLAEAETNRILSSAVAEANTSQANAYFR